MENNDLIRRSDLNDKLDEMCVNDAIYDSLQAIPTVDAVPVVRCGECINYGYRNRHWDDICLKNEPKGCRKWLDKMGMFIIDNPNDFCSYGERKEANQ